MGYTNAMSSVCLCSPFCWIDFADYPPSYHVGFPDPFAVATVGGEQTHTTSVIKKTLNPYWNEIFDLYAMPSSPPNSAWMRPSLLMIPVLNFRRVNEDSILAIQIFDQKKFKKKDQGFLGVINVRIGDVIDMQMGGDGESIVLRP